MNSGAVSATVAAGSNFKELENRVHEKINEQRVMRGLAPLRWSEPLAEEARKHAGSMASQHFFPIRIRSGETSQKD